MQRSHVVLSMITAVLLFSACKKNDSPPEPAKIDDIVYVPYSRLAPGNYWVYDAYELDSNYNVLFPRHILDSMYVEKDTLINFKTYYKYWQPQDVGSSTYYATYLRDSLHYIVDNNGTIRFSSQDFTTLFYSQYLVDTAHVISPLDTPCRVEKKMADQHKSITVPAGTFVTNSWQTTYYMHPYFASYAPAVRRINTRYAAGIGMISETMPFYVSSPNYTERRLLRYHVQ